MAKRKRSSRSRIPRALVLFAAGALALFAIGEAWFLSHSDAGRLALGRLGFGDPAHLVRIVGRHAREALEVMGVPRDSVEERVAENGEAPVEWRVGLRPDASTLQVHHAIQSVLEGQGARVFSGRERFGPEGELRVRLVAGVGRRRTHVITLVLPPRRPATGEEPYGGRLALVLYGFGEDDSLARAVFSLAAPFAVALAPAAKGSATQFALAHARAREVVLHVPLEPVNYPQINPGPGTILVTMTPSQIASRMRKYVDRAEPVVAVANHMGSLATQDMTVMTALFRELKRERLPFVHVNPAPGAVCRSLSSDLGVVYDEPDAMIDAEARGADARALERRWKKLLAAARERGRLVVWVRATPTVARWLPRAAAPARLEGVSLVPLSALLRRPVAS